MNLIYDSLNIEIIAYWIRPIDVSQLILFLNFKIISIKLFKIFRLWLFICLIWYKKCEIDLERQMKRIYLYKINRRILWRIHLQGDRI